MSVDGGEVETVVELVTGTIVNEDDPVVVVGADAVVVVGIVGRVGLAAWLAPEQAVASTAKTTAPRPTNRLMR